MYKLACMQSIHCTFRIPRCAIESRYPFIQYATRGQAWKRECQCATEIDWRSWAWTSETFSDNTTRQQCLFTASHHRISKFLNKNNKIIVQIINIVNIPVVGTHLEKCISFLQLQLRQWKRYQQPVCKSPFNRPSTQSDLTDERDGEKEFQLNQQIIHGREEHPPHAASCSFQQSICTIAPLQADVKHAHKSMPYPMAFYKALYKAHRP